MGTDALSADVGDPAGPAGSRRWWRSVEVLHIVNGVVGVAFAVALASFLRASHPIAVVAPLVTAAAALSIAGALRRGRLRRPPSPRSRWVAFWLLAWPWPIGWLLTQARAFGSHDDVGAEPLGASDLVTFACFLVMVIALVFAARATAPRAPVDAGATPVPRPGHDLSWRQRREIARAVRGGRPLNASRDDDVRAVIDRMLDWEFVAWVALLAAFGLAAFALVGALAGRGSPGLWTVAAVAVAVTVVVLRRMAATKRYRRRLDTLRPGPPLGRPSPVEDDA